MVGKRRKTKRKSTVGTQTDVNVLSYVPIINNNVVVKIKRLGERELNSLLSKQQRLAIETTEEPKRISQRRRKSSVAMLHPQVNARQSLSRLPSNYSHFVRPINNREVANSTVVNISPNEEQSVSYNDDVNLDEARIMSCKPGPRSFKIKMLRREERLRAPMALSTPKHAEKGYNQGLSEVAEDSEGSIPTPVLHQEIRVDVHEVPIRTVAIGTESEQCTTAPESERIEINDNLLERNLTTVELYPTSTQTEKIANCEISGITFKSPSKNSDSKSNGEKHQEDDSQQTKYIRIHAHTVHIHNHFYKT